MKPRIYLIAAAAIVALGSLPFLAGAQIITADGKKSDEIMLKIHKMDMVNQLLPVLMTTSQVKEILRPIEDARQAEKMQMSKEAAELRKVEKLSDDALKDAIEMRKVVPQEVMRECAATVKGLTIARTAMATDQVDKVLAKVQVTLDAGQQKAAANSSYVEDFFPGKKPGEVPESTRLRTWVKYVLMDYQSYDLLIALSKKQ
jgi:hypothetical protein